jgi:Site-specific recombinase XerD
MYERNIPNYSEKVALEYIEANFGQKEIVKLTHYQKDHLRHVVSLSHFLKTGKIPIYINRRPQYELNSDFRECVENYLEHKRSMRVRESTLRQHKWHLHQFTEFISSKGVSSIQSVSPLDLMHYATESFPNEPAAKNATLIIVRRFLKYLYDYEYIKRDLSLVVPKDYYRQQAKLPSTYTKEEVRTILDSINRSKNIGKRDYAIVMLAVRLGMRASDIAELQFNGIQWATDKISFTQMKTGRPVQLPLPSDVGESIIIYIQNSRPISDSPYVFLSPRYPHKPIDSQAISSLVQKIIIGSGVKIGNRKHGPHALRHTMASFMINEGTSLPIISEVLGHSSVQTSMNYLRISIEAMRQCAAEVPLVPISFYEQKGGAFYG